MSLRLNLGSGPHPTPGGWLSVDSDPAHSPAVLADVGALPFDDDSAEALYAGHLLEHVPLAAIAPVLAEWRRVLASGGELVIVGPDIDRAVDQGEPAWLIAQIVAHGGDGPASHAWTCSETVLRHLLEQAGWTVQPVDVGTISEPEWPNYAPQARWQLALRCR